MSQAIVDAVNAKYPHLLRKNDHEADGHFLYYACQALGPSWMLLGKSGGENGFTWPNGVRTSHDAICQVDASGGKLQQVDIITAAGDGNPTSPGWGIIPPHHWRTNNEPVPLSKVPSPSGSVPSPPPEPPAGPLCPDPSAHLPKPPRIIPDRGEMMDEARALDAFYRAPEGLQRTHGLSIGGGPDWEGVGAWLFDVYLMARIAGKSREDARELYRDQIRASQEWQQKHRR